MNKFFTAKRRAWLTYEYSFHVSELELVPAGVVHLHLWINRRVLPLLDSAQAEAQQRLKELRRALGIVRNPGKKNLRFKHLNDVQEYCVQNWAELGHDWTWAQYRSEISAQRDSCFLQICAIQRARKFWLCRLNGIKNPVLNPHLAQPLESRYIQDYLGYTRETGRPVVDSGFGLLQLSDGVTDVRFTDVYDVLDLPLTAEVAEKLNAVQVPDTYQFTLTHRGKSLELKVVDRSWGRPELLVRTKGFIAWHQGNFWEGALTLNDALGLFDTNW